LWVQELVVVTCKAGQAHGYGQTRKEPKGKGKKDSP
jgi:hypothetical protein